MLNLKLVAVPNPFTVIVFHCDITKGRDIASEEQRYNEAFAHYFPNRNVIFKFARPKDADLHRKAKLLGQAYELLIVAYPGVVTELLEKTAAPIDVLKTKILWQPSVLAEHRLNRWEFMPTDRLGMRQVAAALQVEQNWDSDILTQIPDKFIPLEQYRVTEADIKRFPKRFYFFGIPA